MKNYEFDYNPDKPEIQTYPELQGKNCMVEVDIQSPAHPQIVKRFGKQVIVSTSEDGITFETAVLGRIDPDFLISTAMELIKFSYRMTKNPMKVLLAGLKLAQFIEEIRNESAEDLQD